jgi:lipid II:glycine glycyltransferase (peptidoglycan interpeptide bridge formation enzyme)
MQLILVEQVSGNRIRLVSGSILLGFGSSTFWAFTGTRKSDFSLHPNDLCIWHSLHASCRENYRWFDLGEVAENHPALAQFKVKWGTITKPMYRYYYPASPTGFSDKDSHKSADLPERMAGALWRRLPLRATAWLGDWIYRYL